MVLGEDQFLYGADAGGAKERGGGGGGGGASGGVGMPVITV